MNTAQPQPVTLPFAELPGWTGRELGVSRWLTIDQAMVDRFADLTGDFNWIHVDRERAARELGGPIAHGLLVLSLVPQLRKDVFRLTGAGPSLNYGYDQLRFTGQTPVDSRIRLRLGVKAISAKGASRRVTFSMIVERDGAEKPVLVADWIVLLQPASDPCDS
jgi:acyl dehydratase